MSVVSTILRWAGVAFGVLVGGLCAGVAWLVVSCCWPDFFYGSGASTYTNGQRPFWDRDDWSDWFCVVCGAVLGGWLVHRGLTKEVCGQDARQQDKP
jgi:hypothetical protein